MQTFLLGLRYFFIDLIGGVIKWPIWWYSRGLVYFVKGGMNWISGYSKSLALSVWIKNIFVPMFGMYDWQSRIISFLMRVFQIIIRSLGVLAITIVVLFSIVIYIFAPPITVIAIIYQFISIYG